MRPEKHCGLFGSTEATGGLQQQLSGRAMKPEATSGHRVRSEWGRPVRRVLSRRPALKGRGEVGQEP